MKKINLLKIAIRKNRLGQLGAEEMDEIFRDVEEGLLTFSNNFEKYRYELREFEADRLLEYQDALFKINTLIEEKSYHSALAD